MKQIYCLKKPSNRKYYYYKLPGEKNYRSTGLTVKAKVNEYVMNLIYGVTQSVEIAILNEFTQNMFIPDKCSFIQRRKEKGKNISKFIAKMRRGHLDNYILPKYGCRRIDSLSTSEIDNWLMSLKLANKTKNHILATFRIIFDEAIYQDIIDNNPVCRISQFAKTGKERVILTLNEIETLFPDDEAKIVEIWGSQLWATMFYTLLVTGLRLGEIKALKWEDWHQDFSVFHINKALKNDETIGSTKNGEARVVLIIDRAIDMLNKWKSETIYSEDNDLIFCFNKNMPVSRCTCSRHFKQAIENAEIDIDGRTLVPHSLRHTANTYYRKTMPDNALRLLTGHLDKRMTDHYDHPTLEDCINKVIPFKQQMEKAWNCDSEQNEDAI